MYNVIKPFGNMFEGKLDKKKEKIYLAWPHRPGKY